MKYKSEIDWADYVFSKLSVDAFTGFRKFVKLISTYQTLHLPKSSSGRRKYESSTAKLWKVRNKPCTLLTAETD
jgi:hypothetical protein